jgi:hypothetical protein
VVATWLPSAASGSTADLTALRPELAELIERFDAEAAAGIEAHLRRLLAALVADLVRDPAGLAATSPDIAEQLASWPRHPAVSDAERAALELAESFVMDVHSITDEQVARVQSFLGNQGAVAVLMNLALLDGLTKFRRVFGEEGI